MKQIRVCMYIPSFYPVVGGAERQAQMLAGLLVRQHQHAFVLTRRLGELLRSEEIDGVPVHRVLAGSHPLVFALSSSLRLLQLRHTYDVIHTHTLNSPALVACCVGKLLRKRVIIKIPRTGKGSFLESLQGSLSGRLRMAFMKHTADAFIALNREAELTLQKRGVGSEKIVCIPNGVDAESFCPAGSENEKAALRRELGLPQGSIGIFVGRLIPRKRADLIIDAWKKIGEIVPDSYLLIIGEGPEREELKRQIHLLNLDNNVRLLGNLDQGAVRKHLQAADIFILSSESEGVPNAMLESMSVGLAVIATRIGGTDGILSAGENGLVFEVGDTEELQRKLIHVLKNKEYRGILGRMARETIIDSLSLEAIAAEYILLYKRLSNA
ncbi:glycosyltransferase family 4 protein [Candidatus Bipolaricaulota bacterium]